MVETKRDERIIFIYNVLSPLRPIHTHAVSVCCQLRIVVPPRDVRFVFSRLQYSVRLAGMYDIIILMCYYIIQIISFYKVCRTPPPIMHYRVFSCVRHVTHMFAIKHTHTYTPTRRRRR